MEYSFYDFLKLIGSLGLFLYGMKIMSEGLQKVAGDRLRSILTAMTTNRVTGVLTGVLITALIQSSSATTVMVVSFSTPVCLHWPSPSVSSWVPISVRRLRHGLFQFSDLRLTWPPSLFHFWPSPFRSSSPARATASPSVNSFSVFPSSSWDFLT